jgi:hypothetical protein
MDMETRAAAPPFGPEELRGLKFFGPLEHLLVNLHQLYPDAKRKLHYDDYLLLLLLAYYNPIISSTRAICHCSGFRRVQKGLGVAQTSLGSLSDHFH